MWLPYSFANSSLEEVEPLLLNIWAVIIAPIIVGAVGAWKAGSYRLSVIGVSLSFLLIDFVIAPGTRLIDRSIHMNRIEQRMRNYLSESLPELELDEGELVVSPLSPFWGGTRFPRAYWVSHYSIGAALGAVAIFLDKLRNSYPVLRLSSSNGE